MSGSLRLLDSHASMDAVRAGHSRLLSSLNGDESTSISLSGSLLRFFLNKYNIKSREVFESLTIIFVICHWA